MWSEMYVPKYFTIHSYAEYKQAPGELKTE